MSQNFCDTYLLYAGTPNWGTTIVLHSKSSGFSVVLLLEYQVKPLFIDVQPNHLLPSFSLFTSVFSLALHFFTNNCISLSLYPPVFLLLFLCLLTDDYALQAFNTLGNLDSSLVFLRKGLPPADTQHSRHPFIFVCISLLHF